MGTHFADLPKAVRVHNYGHRRAVDDFIQQVCGQSHRAVNRDCQIG